MIGFAVLTNIVGQSLGGFMERKTEGHCEWPVESANCPWPVHYLIMLVRCKAAGSLSVHPFLLRFWNAWENPPLAPQCGFFCGSL